MTRKKNDAPPNIHYQPLTERQARSVAAWLKRNKYDATVEQCRKKSIVEIVGYFEPLDPDRAELLLRELPVAAGLQPEREDAKI